METNTQKKEALNGHSKEDDLSWKDVLKNIELSDSMLSENYFKRASAIFFKLNKEIGSIIAVGGEKVRLDLDKGMKLLQEEFKIGEGRIIRAHDSSVGLKKTTLDQVLFLVDRELLVSFEFTFNYGYVIFYCSTTDKKKLKKINELMDTCKIEPQPNYTNFLVNNSGRLSLRAFKIDAPVGDILSNYNDDFVEVDKLIKERLQETSKGILLLHGPPGTGKSSYLKYLISVLKKRIIYIPSESAGSISSPDFLKFIMDYPDTILIIEDAEDIISERGHGGGYTISNLLNLSDGIIGDCLRIQVVCTFNCSLENIDPALLRRGRLISRYYFDLLEIEKCQAILKRLNVVAKVEKKMSLADLYNMMDKDFSVPEKVVGFKTAKK